MHTVWLYIKYWHDIIRQILRDWLDKIYIETIFCVNHWSYTFQRILIGRCTCRTPNIFLTYWIYNISLARTPLTSLYNLPRPNRVGMERAMVAASGKLTSLYNLPRPNRVGMGHEVVAASGKLIPRLTRRLVVNILWLVALAMKLTLGICFEWMTWI